MQYRDLLKKRVCLIGTEKICSDIQEFFSELVYEHVEVVEDNNEIWTKPMMPGSCDLIVLGVEQGDIISEDYVKATLPILTLTDLFEIVDELETFYIDKMFHDKTICVFGDDERISELTTSNPNLKIDYLLTEADSKQQYNYSLMPVEKLADIPSPFVIIADKVNEHEKNRFIELGLEFGKEFHFYNSRIPKNYTSYYLRKTMMDAPKYTMHCDYANTKALSIKAHGNVMACCSSVTLALGNCLYTSIEEILQGIQAQLICLSVNNRTYSFCGDMCFVFREKKYSLNNDYEIRNNPRKKIGIRQIKDFNVQLGYDRSCNLACPSCRDHRITKPEDSHEIVEMIHDEVKKMCRKNPMNIRIGNGELFFSQYYKDIIFNCYESESIALISNGMLFTPENWNYLKDRYKNISLEVSMDATRQETYKKLRGGDLTKLKKNMEFAGSLRREGKIKKLSISFVIQVENFREMIEFVEYGKTINADFIHFMKLNSWGHIPEEKFIEMDVYDERNDHHTEFVRIINNPLFLEPYVHVDNINNFLSKDA